MPGSYGRTTIYDVASRAGVSISTVSLALNRPDRVNARTRQRILQIASELGYRRGGGPSAPQLVRIAVAAPFSSYPSYFERLAGMLDRTRDAQLEISVHDLAPAPEGSTSILGALPSRADVDGLVVMGLSFDEEFASSVRDLGPPTVLVDIPDEAIHPSGLPFVLVDDKEGGRLIGEHLASLGHLRAVCLQDSQIDATFAPAGLRRLEGLMKHLRIDVMGASELDDPEEGLLARVRAVDGPRAVVATDQLALKALSVLRGSGLNVPQDVSVIGYQDSGPAEVIELTTVRQPLAQAGRIGLELLLSILSGEAADVAAVILRPELVIRSTTAPPS